MKLRNRRLMCLPPFLQPRPSTPKSKINKSPIDIDSPKVKKSDDSADKRTRKRRLLVVESDTDEKDIEKDKKAEADEQEISTAKSDAISSMSANQRYLYYQELLRQRIIQTRSVRSRLTFADAKNLNATGEKLTVNGNQLGDRSSCRTTNDRNNQIGKQLGAQKVANRSIAYHIVTRSGANQIANRSSPNPTFQFPEPCAISCPICYKFFNTTDLKAVFEDHLKRFHFQYWMRETGGNELSALCGKDTNMQQEKSEEICQPDEDDYVPNCDVDCCKPCSFRGIQCSGNMLKG